MTKPTIRHRAMPVNSVEAIALAVLDRAHGPIAIPRHLHVPRAVRPFLEDVLSSRHRHLWTPAELPLAVHAARLMHALANQTGTMREQVQERALLLPKLLSLLRLLRIVGWRPLPRPRLPHVNGDDDLLAS